MKCPNDQHSLSRENFKGVLVDRCKKCSGVWFDRDELTKAKDNTDNDLRWLDFDLFEERTGKFHTSSGNKTCPIDGTKMLVQVYADSKIPIDTCPQCRGVWLDSHEFDQIINHLHKHIYSETAGEYSKDLLKELIEVGNGPENSESEVKDFAAVLRLFETRLMVENSWVVALNEFLYTNLPLK